MRHGGNVILCDDNYRLLRHSTAMLPATFDPDVEQCNAVICWTGAALCDAVSCVTELSWKSVQQEMLTKMLTHGSSHPQNKAEPYNPVAVLG